MKKVKSRSLSILILVLIMGLGLGIYIVSLAVNGGKWASFAAGRYQYAGGGSAAGAITDRNGVTLTTVSNGKRIFADDETLRKSTLHVVGDHAGNIGTGAMRVFAADLTGYDFINGVYTLSGGGENVELSIDAELNKKAYSALNGKKGAVLVQNYETGEILCMVSSPTFDPANPPEIKDDDPQFEGVYINRALSSSYTPGSIFKLVTAAASIEKIPDIFERKFECTGSMNIGSEAVTCMKVHGSLTFEDALAVSCNSVFAELSLELGADTLERYASNYGLVDRNSVSGIKTAKGLFEKAPDDSAGLAWSGIGQYDDLICPASMLRFVSAVANDGAAPQMTLLKKTGILGLGRTKTSRVMKKETAEELRAMMSYNVYYNYGEKNFPGLKLYAKSGTAEVGGGKQPHSWFTGFIKNDGHPLAFIVIVENGGMGSDAAAKVANTVLQAAVSR